MICTVTLNPTIDRTMHFPHLAVGKLNRARHSVTDLSGKGINVSVALRRFGIPSVLTGYVAGAYGRVLVEGLEAAGFTCRFLSIAGETRSNVTVIDEARGETTKLNEPGPTIDDEDLIALCEHLHGLYGAAPKDEQRVCVLSGSAPPGAPDDVYARIITLLRDLGVETFLDTSGAPLVAGCVAGPDWLKPNEVEANELTGRRVEAASSDRSLREVTTAMRAMGPRRVLLTLGPRGAVLDDGHSVWMAEPPAIRELSAVASGDACLAGALAEWLCQGGDVSPGAERGPLVRADEIVRRGVAAGTATAGHEGSGVPQRDVIDAMYDRVRVRCLGPSEQI